MQPGDKRTVCGDMNVEVSNATSDSLNLENTLLLCGLKLLKKEGNRITKSSQSTIDVCFTNFYLIVVVQNNSKPDHEAVNAEAPL